MLNAQSDINDEWRITLRSFIALQMMSPRSATVNGHCEEFFFSQRFCDGGALTAVFK